MPLPTDNRQQSQLELEGLKRTLEWREIQREQLLDRLDLLRRTAFEHSAASRSLVPPGGTIGVPMRTNDFSELY